MPVIVNYPPYFPLHAVEILQLGRRGATIHNSQTVSVLLRNM
jgi:hypothetical protein